MKGLRLSSLTGELKKVAEKYQGKPAATIKSPTKRIDEFWKKEMRNRADSTRFHDYYSRLPLQALSKFSFDELCKLNYSTIFFMHETVGKLFATKARYEIVEKIKSSMWRWGSGAYVWNEVVDAYEHIRNFVFHEDPNFEIRIDHSTHHHECGYAKYSRIFIDGVFASLVYYKKKHVMTIGFSITEGRRVLIQQVQSAERSGNRYLYRLPANRMEFVIELFQNNFPGYGLYVIDAKFLLGKTLRSYRNALDLANIRATRLQQEADSCTDFKRADALKRLTKTISEVRLIKEHINHLRDDQDRLDAFYRNTGRFRLDSEKFIVNNLVHYKATT
ncbi:MAG: hypothetical protein M0P64_00495 [Candidatus Pacebacteria bacterium]|jgi:hypothetical protein|nr:hypothetical protein [Candidatus Paceibacterota bacterium]